MNGQVFMNVRVPKLDFSASRSLFCQKLPKLNAQAKFTSQNLMVMPRQKLTPEKLNAQVLTSVPPFIRESPPRLEIIC